jgi:MoxR-like ATPase
VTLLEEHVAQLRARAEAIEQQVRQVIVGQADVVHGVLVCLLAGGHALLEGVPGLGKTELVKALSQALDLRYSRIQFTPDLMPADLTGTSVLLQEQVGNHHVTFQPGPVFANLVLADEINRATPRTQSALLEAMQEQTVTIGNATHALPRPFFVLATQNPIEMEGTYPLPEAELDRFLFKLRVAYPDRDDLAEIFRRTTGDHQPVVEPVADAQQIISMQRLARQLPIASHVADYAIRLVLATHPSHAASPRGVQRFVRYGASPRAGQAMILAAKVEAALAGSYNVAYEDIRRAALPALRHRLILNFEAEAQRIDPDALITELLDHIPQDG